MNRWAVSVLWMNGRRTVYTVDTEEKAKELGQTTKDMYKGCRVFVGYEIAQSTSAPATEDDSD